jgi:hypothetical protein
MAKTIVRKQTLTTTEREIDLPNLPGNDLDWYPTQDGLRLRWRDGADWQIIGTVTADAITLHQAQWGAGTLPLTFGRAAELLVDAYAALEAGGAL